MNESRAVLKITHAVEPATARKLLGLLQEVRAINDAAIAHVDLQIEHEQEDNVLRRLLAEREMHLQIRSKLLLSNLLRVAVDNLVTQPFAPSDLFARMTAN